jgi:phospholipid/cholesterol/gamma-HCH transport system ATP-binding protein
MSDQQHEPEAGSLWEREDEEAARRRQPAPDPAPEPQGPHEKGELYDRILEQAQRQEEQDAQEPQRSEPEPEALRTGRLSPEARRDPSNEAIIRLVGLSKSFGSLAVFDDLTLDLHGQQTTVVLGPSGVGKSVLLKLVVGLIKPDRGEVWFEGKRVDRLAERDLVDVRKKIGFLFQQSALFDSMDVGENVAFPLVEHRDMSPDQRREQVAKVLKMVGLPGVESKMPAELSGGQRKRVALARAIVLEPDVVFYDEPTTGLDPIRADLIGELIQTLARNLNITSVVVTHDMPTASKIADRLVMLYDGKVIADGDAQAFANSENDLVRRFVKGQADQEDLDRIRAGFTAGGGLNSEGVRDQA